MLFLKLNRYNCYKHLKMFGCDYRFTHFLCTVFTKKTLTITNRIFVIGNQSYLKLLQAYFTLLFCPDTRRVHTMGQTTYKTSVCTSNMPRSMTLCTHTHTPLPSAPVRHRPRRPWPVSGACGARWAYQQGAENPPLCH